MFQRFSFASCIASIGTLLLIAECFSFGGDGSEPLIRFIVAPDDSLFQIGEELTYNVSYAVVDIGQVRIKVVDKTQENGRTVYKTMAYIDSYKGIPFVDLHTIYESAVSESLYATRFRSRTKVDADWRYFIYNFDYPRNAVFIEQGLLNAGKIERFDTLRIKTLHQDGLSLFFYARSRIRQKHEDNIPTVVSEQNGSTYINFENVRTKEEIDAIDYPVDVVHFEGRADFVGIYGLSGEFEGWFSNDAARVPILAKMKVLIGSIRIELMKWKREGWIPPRFEGNEGR